LSAISVTLERMFEPPVVEVADTVALAGRLDASVEEQLRRDAERVVLVAAWADHHPVVTGEQVDSSWSPYRRRASVVVECYAAEGTPDVSQFAAEELGCLLRTTTAAAGRLMRDVLDLRHRMPAHYAAVTTGRVELWKARKVVRLTTELSLEDCWEVDRVTVAATVGLPFGRAEAAVKAAMIQVDPVGHAERIQDEQRQCYVSRGRPSNQHGFRTLIARSHAGAIARFDAMVGHLAELMLRAGDASPVQVRRAKAFGILANPALACVWLAGAHPAQDNAEPEPEPGPEPEPEPERPADPDDEPAPEPEPVHVSAVDAAVLVGRALQALGAKAVERLRPQSVLYLHLSQEAVQGIAGTQVARVEGIGPIGVEQLRRWLHTDRVTVRPVLDPLGVPAVDAYEVRGDLREAVQLLHPYEMFPWGTLVSRSADTDHTVPYVPIDEGGPPGQSRIGNLGPLGRGHHNAKTYGGFTCHQPLPGMFLWRTPTGHWYQVDNHGTHPLGRDRPAILRQREQPPGVSRMEQHFANVLQAAA
jgi:hypothetical protein